MKLRVNKRWWQFWLPNYVYIDMEAAQWNALYKNIADEVTERYFSPQTIIDPHTHPLAVKIAGEDLDQPSAIEANEAEPWYNSEPSASDSVVTAEPDLVAKNRGNATMRERMNGQ